MGRKLLGVALVALTLSGAWAADPPKQTAEDRLMALEARSGRRLGVAALDTGTGRRVAHRAGERFAMCSTFKLALAGAVLASVDAGKESLDRRVAYSSADLLSYAPVTREHAKEGSMTVGALCASAVEVSDNTAANLLLRTLGGPVGFTRFLRALGDEVTRLDRDEPTLNTNEPGDVRDTTTPDAMLATMKALLLGDALSPASRRLLQGWLVASTTGAARLRAGVPPSWRVGDKTGTGANGATNDLAILWPPGRAPILIAAYSTGAKGSDDERSALLAEVAMIVVKAIEKDG
jgi:beta-lactamase class A